MSGESTMFRRLAGRSSRYPYNDLPRWAKKAIISALHEAWCDIIAEGEDLEDENAITTVLVDGLNTILSSRDRAPRFNTVLFQTVSRDSCAVTYNAAKLHKRPDIIIRMAHRAQDQDEYKGWFIECKIVDKTHPPNLYSTKGIKRFEKGEYAWAMPSAMMVAYAGAGYSIENVPGLSTTEHSPRLHESHTVHISTHPRPIFYPDTDRQLKDITLYHLWLRDIV